MNAVTPLYGTVLAFLLLAPKRAMVVQDMELHARSRSDPLLQWPCQIHERKQHRLQALHQYLVTSHREGFCGGNAELVGESKGHCLSGLTPRVLR